MERAIGEVCFWNKEKGWGFAEVTKPVEGQTGLEERDTIFVHHSDLGGKLPHVGDLVTFEVTPSGNPKHPWRASDVRIIRFAGSAASKLSVEVAR